MHLVRVCRKSDGVYVRILVSGGPKVGKTTLAATFGAHVMHTDMLPGWSEASAKAAEWMLQPGPWVIEGTAVVRAVRKFIHNSVAKPCDIFMYGINPKVPRSAGQISMAKGCETIFREVVAELISRGVIVETF